MKDYRVTFYIHDDVYIYASCYTDRGRVKKSTGTKTDTGTIDNLPRNIQRTLNRISIAVDEYVGLCGKQGEPVRKLDVERIIALAAKGLPTAAQPLTVLQLLEQFYKAAESGELLNRKEKRYPTGTLRVVEYTIKALKKYPRLAKVKVADLDISYFSELKSTLTRDGMAKNTVSTRVNTVLTVINKTYDRWHKKQLKGVEGLRGQTEDVDYPIFYNIEQLQALYNHDFKGRKALDRLRDVFVLGSFICLRHSDYYPTDFSKAIRGNILEVKSNKTDNPTYVPLHPIAKMIMEKYEYRLPKIGYEAMRSGLKVMAELAGFKNECLFTRVQGGVTVRIYKPMYMLTTPHTMRRNFATNAKLAGMSDGAIMKIGGWKTFTAYERYLRLSGLDIAELAMKEAFYQNWNW